MKRLLFALLVLGSSLPALAAKTPYTYVRVGNAGDVSTQTTPGTVLMGGGADVDDAFRWLCERSGGGDFLVIRATGTDAYNAYVRALCPAVNSVATLIIPSTTAANHAQVADYLSKAEAIWIAGGDQANYVNYWTGTGVQAGLDAAMRDGVPVGGTSAGMNVLTQFVYSALLSQGVTSSQALANPFNKYMTFARDFTGTPYLRGIIGDPHFVTRDRMGRDLAFLCRMYANGWTQTPRAVAVDEATALTIDGNGLATVVGTSTAYFLQALAGPETCKTKTPLTYRNVDVYRIRAGAGSFNLTTWSGDGGSAYTVGAENGVVSSTQGNGSPY